MTIEQDHMDNLIKASLLRIKKIEAELWAAEPDDHLLEQYQTAFQEFEHQLSVKGGDERHEFILVIPVADRPQQLQSCLDSVLHLCKTFGYGGYADNRFLKVSAIIADDSRNSDSINANMEIANECNRQGLTTLYFGQGEQLDQLDALNESEANRLRRILGNTRRDAFYHKGASIMRNITYLELGKIRGENSKILFYFIDSAQEFQLKVSTASGDKNLYACNYFFYLDQIFSRTETLILTGKVVGDTPVSPSVIPANFLDDVISFVQQLAAHAPADACQFHRTAPHNENKTSYHDMASTFGPASAQGPCQYHCTLTGKHDSSSCLGHFSDQLNHYFYGEHTPCKTYYQHEDILGSVQPARTVYTGNYIFKPEALKYFIPFAALKLRMAGTVLGRLIKSEIQSGFVSANLPMLHKRTVYTSGKSEFRSGISEETDQIDLSGEVERQFYGDVMLFSVETLIDMGYPNQIPHTDFLARTVAESHVKMLQQYKEKRKTISDKLNVLRQLFYSPNMWWQQSAEYAAATKNFTVFMDNIEHNFGEHSSGYALLDSADNKTKRHAEIVHNIACYTADRTFWEEMLRKHDSLTMDPY